MALITRISRLFRADFHAVLDRMEEPQVLLKQAVREMEDHLAANQHHIRTLQHDTEQLHNRQIEMDVLLKRYQEEISMCFNTGNDTLVRGVIKKKLIAEKTQQTLSKRRDTLEQALEQQQTLYRENQSHYESMRQKAELLAEEQKTGSSLDAMSNLCSGTYDIDNNIDDNAIELAFIREQQRYTQGESSIGDTP